MNKDILEQWVNTKEQAEAAFVSAPITFPPIPSIALSLFKSALTKAGISSRVIYPVFLTNHLLGVENIYKMEPHVHFKTNGEYLFAHLTDAAAACSLDEYMQVFFRNYSDLEKDIIRGFLGQGKKAAEMIVDAVARRIIHMGARIVAASSIFSQQNASLAIFKRVKELDPTISTIIGGYNVSGEMGKVILRNYPSVDYVSFGEGDETIVQVCEILLGRRNEAMPYGILGKNDAVPDIAPYRMTQDLDKMPSPDYSDFFEEADREASGFYGDVPVYYGETYENTIFLEGSRGCWWGAKRACAFCGLNGLNNVYREKSPERLYEEIKEAGRRYPGAKIQLSDNVLSRRMIRELTPLLAADPEKYSILAEIKTNLNPSEIQMLYNAGFTVTQPGIESVNDHLLTLMGKGSSAAQNIAILKYGAACGMTMIWNMLTGIPGEAREDYEQILELIPLICHLYPPTWASRITFNRFSRYTDDPEEYGLELTPETLYKCCYKGNEDLIRNMGVYYSLAGGPFLETVRQNYDIYGEIDKAVKNWRKLIFSKSRPVLIMNENILGIGIFDTRPIACESRTFILGLNAKIYRMAYEPVSLESLCRQLPDVSEQNIRASLENLISRKLMIKISGRYLALAVEINRQEQNSDNLQQRADT